MQMQRADKIKFTAILVTVIAIAFVIIGIINFQIRYNRTPMPYDAIIYLPTARQVVGHVTYFHKINDKQTEIGINGIPYLVHPSNIILIPTQP